MDLGPKGDKALRMGLGGDVRTDGHTDGQIPPVFCRTLSPLGPLPNSRIRVRIGPEGDKALKMGQGGRTDVRIPPVFYRTLSPLGPLPCLSL